METSRLFGIAAVFFGIISVGLSMIFFISFPAAVLAITFGTFAVKKFYRKSGTTGIVLGICRNNINDCILCKYCSSIRRR